MEVRLFPNLRRAGIGLKPRREGQRPLLPQHARHCPVLEAGSALGFMVYPPLEPRESFRVAYDGEGRYRFVYYINPTGGKWERVLTVVVTLPGGAYGIMNEEVTFAPGVPTTSREVALHLMRQFIAAEDLGTPAGGLTLRGAWNFQTPAGWDSVYTPVLNAIERPVVPMLVVRVETDWYVHESEFRYVLQRGEGISVEHSMPIGQVFFVPRELITLRECTDDEVAVIRESQEEFSREKIAQQTTTSYGMPYSPHYLRKSRAQLSVTSAPVVSIANSLGLEDDASASVMSRLRVSTANPLALEDDVDANSPAIRKVGRNDPCPCGSGKKYKKCHGAP